MINIGYPINRTAPLNKGLLAWWLRLPHNTQGARSFDLFNKNHGTINGLTKFGSFGRPGGWAGLSHDGATGTFNISALGSATSLLSGRTTLTFACWFYHRSGGASSAGRVFTVDTEEILYFSNFGGGMVYSVGGTGVNTGVPINNEWYHSILTLDGATMRGYINGLQVASTSFSSAIGACTDLYFFNRAGGDRGWDGIIDDKRFYDRALPADQVFSLYNATKSRYLRELNRIDDEDDEEFDLMAAAAGAPVRRLGLMGVG